MQTTKNLLQFLLSRLNHTGFLVTRYEVDLENINRNNRCSSISIETLARLAQFVNRIVSEEDHFPESMIPTSRRRLRRIFRLVRNLFLGGCRSCAEPGTVSRSRDRNLSGKTAGNRSCRAIKNGSVTIFERRFNFRLIPV